MTTEHPIVTAMRSSWKYDHIIERVVAAIHAGSKSEDDEKPDT